MVKEEMEEMEVMEEMEEMEEELDLLVPGAINPHLLYLHSYLKRLLFMIPISLFRFALFLLVLRHLRRQPKFLIEEGLML